MTGSLADVAESADVQVSVGSYCLNEQDYSPDGVCNQTCRNSTRFPCGCGPNLRWCMPRSSLDMQTAFQSGSRIDIGTTIWLEDHIGLEGRKFVENVVKNDRDYLEILGANYAFRTTRLQHFYDLLHRYYIDPCDQLVDVGQADECSSGSEGSAINYLTFSNTPDWQMIPLPAERRFERGGLLTTAQLMDRQPTEPNWANRVYSYFLCEDIGWRERTVSHTPSTSTWAAATGFELEGTAFSPLRFTPAAQEALGNPNCVGCHVTVNPLAATRNGYDSVGGYNPGASTLGIFLNVQVDGIVARGNGRPGVADVLKSSGAATQCIVNRAFHRLTGEYLPRTSALLRSLTTSFINSGHNMRQLFLTISQKPEYRRQR